MFDIQEKVSRSIVNALKVRLTSEENQKIAAKPISDITAYECYLKANAEVIQLTADGINRAIRYLQNALDIIGENTLLYSGLAFAFLHLVNVGAEHEECLAKAEEFAKRALALDPEFAKAHAMLGWISMWSHPQAASGHFKKAFSISPDDPLVLQGFAVDYVQIVGKIPAASRLLKRLDLVDPLHFTTKWLHGGIHFYSGKYDLALPSFSSLYDTYPDNPGAQFYYAMTLAYLHQTDRAFSIIAHGGKATPDNAFAKLGLMLRSAILKDQVQVFQELGRDFRKTCQRDVTFSHHLAGIFALCEEKKEALEWLENAVDRGFTNYPLLADKDPFLAGIRGEPRFQKLMERVKYEWEHFKD